MLCCGCGNRCWAYSKLCQNFLTSREAQWNEVLAFGLFNQEHNLTCALYARAHNVTQTHKTIRKHNASLCLFSTFCLLARWANTKSRAVVSAKDASSRILCFLCPPCLSLFHERGGGVVLPLTWLLPGYTVKSHMFTHTDSGTWLNGLFSFFF